MEAILGPPARCSIWLGGFPYSNRLQKKRPYPHSNLSNLEDLGRVSSILVHEWNHHSRQSIDYLGRTSQHSLPNDRGWPAPIFPCPFSQTFEPLGLSLFFRGPPKWCFSFWFQKGYTPICPGLKRAFAAHRLRLNFPMNPANFFRRLAKAPSRRNQVGVASGSLGLGRGCSLILF